ncbi:LysR family transcriptional regulator [Phragmitibacter flavus]|uniref:LysR family transcriptional regulator n=1 Tax=Phragmitibacter flavus TaxID=2576071 RepID=A0A5R8KJ16_9BACT|nr:LysR family transcriptional regulator [Phragmitibacter flavus]TLD72250.1 LysR family transcriptional regulator [Phragmitibacter flavus]
MELRHLRYFVAVAEEQNVTRAALRLHVTQPPLTRQIQDLEAELGIALFRRTGKSIHLTDAGNLFLREARAVLNRAEAAVRNLQSSLQRSQIELNIGYAPSPTVEILPKVLRRFNKRNQEVKMTLHDLSSPEMVSGMNDGSLDASFMMKPPKRLARGLNFVPLKTYPIAVATSPLHPLAKKRRIEIADILKHPLVGYSRIQYPDYHEFLRRIVGTGTYRKLQFAKECDSGMTLIAAIESGKGVAITSSSLGATAGKRLVLIPIHPAPSPAVVGLAYPSKNFNPTRALQRLIDSALAVAET